MEWKSAALSIWLPKCPRNILPEKSQWKGSAMNSYVPILFKIQYLRFKIVIESAFNYVES